MSLPWVNSILSWRKYGYRGDTPFGPASKAARVRAKAVQATEQKASNNRRSSHSQEVDAESIRAATVKAEAAKAKAEAQKAKADAAKAEADARRAEAEAERAKFEAHTAEANSKARANHFKGAFNDRHYERAIDPDARDRLVKTLGMLGSDQPGERANAASFADKTRIQLGLSWDDLIVPAQPVCERAA